MKVQLDISSALWRLSVLGCAALLSAGCPYTVDISNFPSGLIGPPAGSGGSSSVVGDAQAEYDRGFAAGFALDAWYWDGYFDGYDTVDFFPIYYDDSDILYVEDPPYDAGFWDGIWYAYNDGYFVEYHYAFLIGFSEGYDNAFWPDYLAFLAGDFHVEYVNGGWSDGYNDGFSEGRVFGANDFEQGLPLDWLDALRDYESGTDLYFAEVGVGTGAWGPVTLYEYGMNPHLLTSAKGVRHVLHRTLRNLTNKSVDLTDPGSLYRPIQDEARKTLAVSPAKSLRTDRGLRLTDSWLDRIETYLTSAKSVKEPAPVRARAVAQE